ncbi:MAG: hypothetical protein Q7S93_07545 [Phenylobacterium sp.]|uniref:hypothetical protein n=1 Tax=Phenylobacterium sp. TaxID=1871053 RepID=UPI00271EEB2B|nr:hypothetical protein [Phenylobacterium sp.]MDO8409899.1 hypothetical protein [Phenylobacterium sp.]
MVASIGASNPFAAMAAAAANKPASKEVTLETKSASPRDEIQQAGGFYEWQKKVKREKLEAMVREQVEAQFAAQGGDDPQALKSAIAEEIAKRLREAIEQEAKADAQSGEAKGAIIDIAV